MAPGKGIQSLVTAHISWEEVSKEGHPSSDICTTSQVPGVPPHILLLPLPHLGAELSSFEACRWLILEENFQWTQRGAGNCSLAPFPIPTRGGGWHFSKSMPHVPFPRLQLYPLHGTRFLLNLQVLYLVWSLTPGCRLELWRQHVKSRMESFGIQCGVLERAKTAEASGLSLPHWLRS